MDISIYNVLETDKINYTLIKYIFQTLLQLPDLGQSRS